jgi:hypothetical protein
MLIMRMINPLVCVRRRDRDLFVRVRMGKNVGYREPEE